MEKKQLNFKDTMERFKISKRYKDIFDLYIHKGEPVPFTIGTIAVWGFCFLMLILTTFTQLNFSDSWLKCLSGANEAVYSPQIPVMLFIIYLMGRNYSILLFITYLITGFFFLPIFAFGGGVGFAQNYLFGYFLGFLVAIFTVSLLLKKSIGIKMRILAALAGVFSIHVTGFLYCFILAIFQVIDPGLILPIIKALSANKLLYDILFGLIILLIAPYIKNIFWICMKPKADDSKKSRKSLRKIQSNS